MLFDKHGDEFERLFHSVFDRADDCMKIDRADDVVNVCEMKFNKSEFTVTKAYADKVSKRISRLESDAPSKTFLPTLITCNALQPGLHSDIFTSSLTLDDLFVAR